MNELLTQGKATVRSNVRSHHDRVAVSDTHAWLCLTAVVQSPSSSCSFDKHKNSCHNLKADHVAVNVICCVYAALHLLSRNLFPVCNMHIWQRHYTGADSCLNKVAKLAMCSIPLTSYLKLGRMQTSNYTFEPLEDMPASFGPRIPSEGLEGFLIVRLRQKISVLHRNLSFHACIHQHAAGCDELSSTQLCAAIVYV